MFIDIHQHLIYGVDDGAENPEQARQMILQASRQGVAHIIATPHAVPGIKPFPLQQCAARLRELNAWCRAQGLQTKLHPGAEIFYTSETPRFLADGRIPTLAGTRCVLVEFSPGANRHHLKTAARKLANTGYRPVFAHIERYRALRSLAFLEELHEEYQVVMQVNHGLFLRRQNFLTRYWLARAMGAGLIDVVASDAHNLQQRPCRLKACHDAIANAYGSDTARRLLVENGRRLLGIRD